MSTIRSIMTTEMLTVEPETSIEDALRLLIDHHISGLPVVDADGTIVGILSEKDVLEVFSAAPDASITVASLMTRKPFTIAVDAPLVDVFDCLMSHDFRRVLIHDGGKLVGLVSRSDLMPAILTALVHRAG